MVPAELAGWCVRAVEADSESDPPLPRLGVSVLRHSKSTIRGLLCPKGYRPDCRIYLDLTIPRRHPITVEASSSRGGLCRGRFF